MVDGLFQEAVEKNNSIRACRRRDYPESTIRFVPTKSTTIDISSTRVRESIQLNIPHEQLLIELQELVLFPEVLLELLTRKRWEERVPSAPITG